MWFVFHQQIKGESVLFLFSILMHHNDAMRNATEDAVETKAEDAGCLKFPWTVEIFGISIKTSHLETRESKYRTRRARKWHVALYESSN